MNVSVGAHVVVVAIMFLLSIKGTVSNKPLLDIVPTLGKGVLPIGIVLWTKPVVLTFKSILTLGAINRKKLAYIYDDLLAYKGVTIFEASGALLSNPPGLLTRLGSRVTEVLLSKIYY